MKSLSLILATAIMFMSCNEMIPPDDKQMSDKDRYSIKVIVVDSCEYIISHVYLGNAICHKGNCKFCEQRRKEKSIIVYDEQNSAPDSVLTIKMDTMVVVSRSYFVDSVN